MKLAVGIVLLGLATLVSLLMPIASSGPSWLGFAWESRRINGVLLALGAGVPIAVGGWGIVCRRLLRWQAIAAIAAFGVVFLKVQLYRGLTQISSAPASIQVMTTAVVLGLATSVVATIVAPDG